MSVPDLQTMARALGGEISGAQVLAPGPNHGSKDRSLAVRPSPDAPDGFVVGTFSAKDDPLDCKDYVRDKLGLPRWAPSDRAEDGEPLGRRRTTATYLYRDEMGEPILRVSRFEPKGFSQSRRENGAWVPGGVATTARVPYRLPELMEALGRGATIYVCEGEKAADALSSRGLAATCSPGGAGKWPDHFARWFAGAAVIVLPDADEPGRRHAEMVVANLKPAADSVKTVALPGLKPKGDAFDYLQAGGDADAISELPDVDAPATGQQAKAPDTLALIDPGSWQGAFAPPRRWTWDHWIPARQATYFTGAGGSGKSLAGQQLATAIALGRPFLGVETRQATALYLTCEDDADELHRRQEAICEALNVSMRELSGRLHLVSLAGAIGNELALFDQLGRMTTTPAWETLRATVLSAEIGFVALDNVAHLFAGSEIIRNQVAAFCGLLNGLAAEANASVLFIGHPNKAGDSFSGSTAWENQVRSRIFLGRPDAEAGSHDPDARVLTREKANYARSGEAIAFRWYRWAFVRDQDLPASVGAEIAAMTTARGEDTTFLQCLAKASEQRRAVSHQKGTNWACSIFSRMPEASGLSAAALERAMERLISAGSIRLNEPLWQDGHRHWKHGIKAASECGDPPAATPCGDPRRPLSEVLENTCGDLRAATPLYTTYKSGAASGAAAPDTESVTGAGS